LWVQIATLQKDEPTARKALERLEIVSKPLYYFHRLSRVEFAFGRLPEARTAAVRGVSCDDSPPFEVLAQLAYCEIELKNLPEAEALLDRLDRKFRNIRRDVRIGLRCRLEIARERYKPALDQSERIDNKDTFIYLRIRRDGLTGELRRSALKDEVRSAYEDELLEVNKRLNDITADRFIPDE
jgi:hypothetical protein